MNVEVGKTAAACELGLYIQYDRDTLSLPAKLTSTRSANCNNGKFAQWYTNTHKFTLKINNNIKLRKKYVSHY